MNKIKESVATHKEGLSSTLEGFTSLGEGNHEIKKLKESLNQNGQNR